MPGQWFSNRGQILQLIFAAIACFLTAVNAWPAVKELQFLALAPIIFYVVFALAALVIIFRRPTAPPITSTRALSEHPKPSASSINTVVRALEAQSDESIPVKFTYQKLKLSPGNYHEIAQGIEPIKITLKDVIVFSTPSKYGEEEAEGAEFQFGGVWFHGGTGTKQVDFKRFICPVVSDPHKAEAGSLYSFVFKDTYFRFIGLRVDHINMHTKEVEFSIGLASGLKRPVL